MKKFLKIGGSVLVLALLAGGTYLWTPAGGKLDPEAVRAEAKTYNVRIIRDNYGVAHIFGKTDADTSFGLGYAHAEDDFATIQEVVLSARGVGAQYNGKDAGPQDFLFDLFKVSEAVEEKYETELKPETRALVEAYAAAMNLYALEHKDEALNGVFPVTGKDVVAGFTWATPFFYRLDGQLTELFSAKEKPSVSPWAQTASFELPEAVRGSNAFAVAPSRSDDNHTRLILNSHQPMNGRYAWYEAHVVSETGMNVAGANFPGTPILTQGVTPHHGWAQTVNRPDLIDIYVLETDRLKNPTKYKLDGEWRSFEKSESKFRVKLAGPFSIPITRDVLWSQHGPVLSTETGHYALKFAGLGEVKAVEQWYEMGKASSFEEWQQVMAKNAVLSFNIVYADKNGNIGTLYNAKMPKRIEGPDWLGYLPGDQSELIWTDYQQVSALPQLWNPDSGWVFSANATPFNITDPESNNTREDYSETFGIERRITNRSRRALELLVDDKDISREELLSYRADTKYHPESALMQMVVELSSKTFDDPTLQKAQDVLRNWDGDTSQNSRGAALAVITGTRALGYEYIEQDMDPVEALKSTTKDLMERYGRLDPKWGDVNRIQRGKADHPLDGAPDVLRAIYADRDGVAKEGVMNAFAGDTHIMIAEWDPEGNLKLDSILQYGAATLDKTSAHYSDQVELFSKGGYKPMPMTLEDVLPLATRDYRPGK